MSSPGRRTISSFVNTVNLWMRIVEALFKPASSHWRYRYVESGDSKMGGNGSGDEVIVRRVKQDHSRT